MNPSLRISCIFKVKGFLPPLMSIDLSLQHHLLIKMGPPILTLGEKNFESETNCSTSLNVRSWLKDLVMQKEILLEKLHITKGKFSWLQICLLSPWRCWHLKAPCQFSSVTQLCQSPCNPRTAAHQASLSITNSQSLPKPMSIESVMPYNHPTIQPSHPLLSPSPSDHVNYVLICISVLYNLKVFVGLLWWSSGQDLPLPVQGA